MTALFAFDGAVFGSWAARIPDVTAQVGATHATLGVALLCVSLGALASMQLTGLLAGRFGAGRVALAGTAGAALVVPLPGLATSIPQLSGVLLLFGALTGMVNVAINSAGVAVEARRPGRALLPALHAAFSLGGLAGAAAGGVASTLGPVLPHLAAVGVVGLVLVAATRSTLAGLRDGEAAPDTDRPAEAHPPRRGRALVVLLGLIAGCTAFGEGAITDWGALHLRETLGATPALAAAGYSCFSLAMACGRLTGGVLLRRLGETRLLGGGALLAAAGMTAALVTSSPELALAGFVLVGLGLANLFPVTIARAGAHSGSRGVALASTVGYSGLLGGPPAIGFLAEHAGLPAAMASVPLLAVVAAGLALAVSAENPRLRLPARLPLPALPTLPTLSTVPERPVRAALSRVARATARPVDPAGIGILAARTATAVARTQPLRIVRTAGSRVAVTARPAVLRGKAIVHRAAADLPALTPATTTTPPTRAPGAHIRPYPGLELLAS
ncbi:MFS transporter [Pseudonocardia halophobica]|uniref:MFS transporter n=1 Tax=Pseudonocardia halophobica TaxID=29401 RepID=UPI003D9344BD